MAITAADTRRSHVPSPIPKSQPTLNSSDLPAGLIELGRHEVHKPWGQLHARPKAAGDPIGEIWYDDPSDPDPPLLVKQLLTSERLSIQVHPADEHAQARGLARGKDEAWFILSAEPYAAIALGPREALTPDRLRAAALDGNIEQLMDWRPVRAGDFIYSPAGTIHAIGAGLTLVEIQQNLDLTYRLYDYGRPRELHLDDAVAVACLEPFENAAATSVAKGGREILACGSAFVVERWRAPYRGVAVAEPDRPLLLIPLTGGIAADENDLEPGSVWKIFGSARLTLEDEGDLLVAYAGAAVAPGIRG